MKTKTTEENTYIAQEDPIIDSSPEATRLKRAEKEK